jgi:hypothetical protein
MPIKHPYNNAKFGVPKTDPRKGDMGPGRLVHKKPVKKVRFSNPHVMSTHRFVPNRHDAKRCDHCGYTARHSLHAR